MQLVVINVGSFISRFAAGTMLPFVGIIDLTIVTAVVCAVLIIGMIWLSSVASVVVLGVLYGLFSGISVYCPSMCHHRVCLALDRYRHRDDGTHVGTDV